MVPMRFAHITILFFSILLFESPLFSAQNIKNNIYYSEEYEKRLMSAIDNLFDRKYEEALEDFKALEKIDPNSPMGKFGQSALYQMRMVEEEDFAFEKEYRKVAKEAQEIIKKKIDSGKADAWIYLISGSSYGLDGLLEARKKSWWDVIKKGYTGLTHIQKAKELDPTLYEADLGIGLYEYFRSKLSEKYSFLPFFEDVKNQGIKRILNAIGKAHFTEYASYLCLCFVYLVEKNPNKLLEYAAKIENKYPNNLIAKIFIARGHREKKEYDQAETMLKKALEIHKDYAIAHLNLGYLYQYQLKKKSEYASQALSHYIKVTKITKSTSLISTAYYNMSKIYEYQKKDSQAEFYLNKASKLNPEFTKNTKKKVKTFGL